MKAAAFPRLYVILDQAQVRGDIAELARNLAKVGVRLFQLRDKQGSTQRVFENAQRVCAAVRPLGANLVVNDRPDIAAMVGAAGVHVGQDDLSPAEARTICGAQQWVGISTHNIAQVRKAAASEADHIAVGPVFGTKTKASPEPVVGLGLIQQAKGLTEKPVVAIGGITLERCGEVFAAGADCVAVAADILGHADPVGRAEAYLQQLGG